MNSVFNGLTVAAAQLPGHADERKTRKPRVRNRREATLQQLPNPWGLSPIQAHCVRAAAQGVALIALGKELCISNKTISSHLTRAREKMGHLSRAQMLHTWLMHEHMPTSDEVRQQRLNTALDALRAAQMALDRAIVACELALPI